LLHNRFTAEEFSGVSPCKRAGTIARRVYPVLVNALFHSFDIERRARISLTVWLITSYFSLVPSLSAL
jgi:hypothetical protein